MWKSSGAPEFPECLMVHEKMMMLHMLIQSPTHKSMKQVQQLAMPPQPRFAWFRGLSSSLLVILPARGEKKRQTYDLWTWEPKEMDLLLPSPLWLRQAQAAQVDYLFCSFRFTWFLDILGAWLTPRSFLACAGWNTCLLVHNPQHSDCSCARLSFMIWFVFTSIPTYPNDMKSWGSINQVWFHDSTPLLVQAKPKYVDALPQGGTAPVLTWSAIHTDCRYIMIFLWYTINSSYWTYLYTNRGNYVYIYIYTCLYIYI